MGKDREFGEHRANRSIRIFDLGSRWRLIVEKVSGFEPETTITNKASTVLAGYHPPRTWRLAEVSHARRGAVH
jgi:hypothetical protein